MLTGGVEEAAGAHPGWDGVCVTTRAGPLQGQEGWGGETALCPQEQPQGLALMRRGACKPRARADPTTHHQEGALRRSLGRREQP